MKMSSLIASKTKRTIAAVMVLLVLHSFVMPGQARATTVFDPVRFGVNIAAFVLEYAGWGKMIGLMQSHTLALSQYYLLLWGQFATLAYQELASAQSIALAIRTRDGSNEAIANYKGNMETLDVVLAHNVGEAKRRSMGPNQQVCRTHVRENLRRIGREVSAVRINREVEAFMERVSGPDTPGASPKSTFLNNKFECDNGFMLSESGADPKCVSQLKTTSGHSIAGLSIMPIGEASMVFPSVENGVQKPKTADEQAYVAALTSIYSLAGDRASRPYGKNANTLKGQPQTRVYYECLANEAAFAYAAISWLDYNTIPNCNNSPELCAKQNQHCLVATEGVLDPAEYGNCERGLSPRERDEIFHRACQSKTYKARRAEALVSASEQSEDATECERAMASYEAMVEQKKRNYQLAVEGFMTNQACWAAVRAF